jgi:hypothetical protein
VLEAVRGQIPPIANGNDDIDSRCHLIRTSPAGLNDTK